MAKLLEKITASLSGTRKNLPAKMQSGLPSQSSGGMPTAKLPNASVIYGIAAGVFLVLAVLFLFQGRWFTGMLMIFPAACFLGFALNFLKQRP